LLLNKYYYDGKTKDEIGRESSTNSREEKCMKKLSIGKPEGKQQFRKPKRKLDDNIKWILKVVFEDVD